MKYLSLMLIAGCMSYAAHAQDTRPVTVKEYIEVVLEHPDIEASEEKIRESDFDMELARLSPAPELTLGNVSGDISGINMPQQFYVGIDYTIEGGRKKKHRVAYAKAGKDVLIAEHNVYVEHFLRQALLTYQRCWMMEQQYKEMTDLDKLIPQGAVDSISLEMLRIHHSLRSNEFEAEYHRALAEFRMLTAHRFENTPVVPCEPVWDTRQLPQQPLPENEPSVQLVRAEQKRREEEIQLQVADLANDISFTIGNNFITEATNPDSPSPHYNAITATVTIPLKLNTKSKPRKSNVVAANGPSDEEQELIQSIKSRYAAVQRENQRLAQQLNQIETLISLEMTQIKKCVDGNTLLEEMGKLQSLRQMRWEKMMQISANNSILHGAKYQLGTQQVTSNR